MGEFDRRTFLALSAGAVATLGNPASVLAQQCVTGAYPSFLPNSLTVDCASRKNFQLFRQNSAYVGLAGAVSMTTVRGKLGTYQAGNLFLFPWLKPKGVALGPGKAWGAVVPANATAYAQADPVPNSLLPQDEYFCRLVLQAPINAFIGFAVDEPFGLDDLRLGYHSNVAALTDRKPAGIMWASSNLNHPWFGGSRRIPSTDICNGAAWRKLIVNGLQQASVGAC